MVPIGIFAVASAVARPLPTCPFADLASSKCVHNHLAQDGALALTGVPGLAAARQRALAEVARCATRDDGGGARRAVLPDGTLRRTFGAETVRGVPTPLASGCDVLGDAAEPLRALVDHTMRRVFGALEELVLPGDAPLLASDSRKGGYASLGDVAQQGVQLEHFHAYSGTEPTANASSAAIPLHTDSGLAIAVVPPLYLTHDTGGELRAIEDAEAGGGGLVVERRDGQMGRLPQALAAGSLILMLGDGWVEWLNPRLSPHLRAAPHAMTMPPPSAAAASPLRLWYGRMYLPPMDALLPPHGFSFASVRERWRDHATRAQRRQMGADPDTDAVANADELLLAGAGEDDDATGASLPVGCAGGARRALADADGCFSNQILCWHVCVSVADLPCGENAVCRNPDSGTLWTSESAHCTTCEPTCDPSPPPPPSPSPPPPSPSPPPPSPPPSLPPCPPPSPAPSPPPPFRPGYLAPPSAPPSPPSAPPPPPPPPPSPPPPPPPLPPSEPPQAEDEGEAALPGAGSSSNLALDAGSDADDRFCSGPGTDMHMKGFAFAPADCIILLFNEWKLDSAARFAAAVFGTVALAVAGEALTWFRRNRMSAPAGSQLRPDRLGAALRWLRRRPTAWRVAMASLFTLQATLGYFLMLVAMTYQGELFIAVVVGLGLGHGLFNTSAPVSESADACCVDDTSDPAATGAAVVRPTRAVRVVDGSPAVASKVSALDRAVGALYAASPEQPPAAAKAEQPDAAVGGAVAALAVRGNGEAFDVTTPTPLAAAEGGVDPNLGGEALDAALLEAAGAAGAAAVNEAAAHLAATKVPGGARGEGAYEEQYDAARRTALASFIAEEAASRPQQRVALSVEFECATCKATVRKALAPVPGVDSVVIDEEKHLATITSASGVKPAVLIDALRIAGKDASVASLG